MSLWTELGFEVWVEEDNMDGTKFTRCVAAFYYWQECLDFKDYALKLGKTVWLRTANPDRETWRTEIRKPGVAND